MTRAASPFLQRRSGIFYVRVRVPDDVQERLGLVEVRRSLGPMRFHEARLLALQLGTRLKECFVMIRHAEDLTKPEVRRIVRDCFVLLEQEADRGYQPVTATPADEVAEQESLAREFLSRIERQIAERQYENDLVANVGRVLSERGIEIADATAGRMAELVEGVARALAEQQRLYLFRLDDRLANYAPTDPLFSVSAHSEAGCVGMTVGELVEEYLKAKKREWTPKTLSTHRPKLLLLLDHLGEGRSAESITAHELWAFRDGLLRLRRNYHTSVAKTFASCQTSAEQGRINAATASNILARAKAMFRWAHVRSYISTNPATAVTVDAPKTKKGLRSRRPFDATDLKKLFGSPMYTGSKSRFRRFEAGPVIVKDAAYWLPVLGYYTGARLGELVQLHFADCVVDGPTPHISINENGPEKHGETDFKHVKSEAGVRIVPLHPDVMAIGFADFVARQRKRTGKSKRLFSDIKYGADGQPSTVFSKWFARCLDKVGLDDPALCYHSFRHTAQDYFRSSQTPKYVIDQIIGHQDQSAAGEYGSGTTLAVAYEVVANLKLPVRLPALIASASD